MSVSYDFGVGGYDISMAIPDLPLNSWIAIKSDIGILEEDANNPSAAFNIVRIGKSNGTNFVEVQNSGGFVIERYSGFQNFNSIRVVFHNEFITVYTDNRWVHTFCLETVYHPEKPIIELSASAEIQVSDIRLKELSDWREAIFIDMETDSMNAISSVILQRPVEITNTWDGAMSFVYNPNRSIVTISDAREYQYALTDSRQACSDAITYFTKVAVVVDPKYAEQFGFVTRMYRMPDLDNGAVEASKMLQNQSRQSAYLHSVRSKIVPALEVGDILRLSVDPVSSVPVDVSFIVERISFQIGDGINSMLIEGRGYAV